MMTATYYRHYVVTRKHPTQLWTYRRACICGCTSPWQDGGPPPPDHPSPEERLSDACPNTTRIP